MSINNKNNEDKTKDTTLSLNISDAISKKNCSKANIRACCEVMIDYTTCLAPRPHKDTEVKQNNSVEANIEKICSGKVIIGGILHQELRYTAISENGCLKPNHVKHNNIPFSCYIDIDCAKKCDNYKIVGCEVICTYSEVVMKEKKCLKKWFYIEKDIIKIIVQKIT